MLSHQIRFEWHIAEEHAPWANLLDQDALRSIPTTLSNAEHRLAVRLMRGIAALVVGIVALSGVAQTPEERVRVRATEGIQAALAREFAAQPDRPNHPDPILLAVNVVEDVAMAEMLVQEPAALWRLSSPYRETRFYRQTEQGWLLAPPGPAFWGGKRYGETDHLRFEYFAPDADTVTEVAVRLEQNYLAIHESLGLDLPPSTEKITVEIAPTSIRGRGIYEGRLETSSPLFSQIPEGMSDADYMAHRVTNRLLYGIVNRGGDEREASYTGAYPWRTVQRGLRSWLQTELIGTPWPWDQGAEDLLRQAIVRRDEVRLADIAGWDAGGPLDRDKLMLQYAAATSVISFVVDTYGRERLIPLMDGFDTYGTWAQMTREVFGVSEAEFEQRWNLYLQGKYGRTTE